MKTIIFVTGNQHKLHEVQAMAPPNFTISSRSLELEEIQSLDLQEIIEHKLQQAYAAVGEPVVAEDVSLGLKSLQGLPGPFIKFFLQRLGAEGLFHDSVVVPDGQPSGGKLSYAEMTAVQKATIGHRGKAFRDLFTKLR